MTQHEPQNDDFMTVDPNRRKLQLREVAGSAAGRYDGIGGELRAARMRNRLDLEAIGVKLRINAAYLLAIEEGRFSDLPGDVYVYGFLRTYAQHLGLDAEIVIQQYKTEAANPKPTAKLDFPSPMDRGRLPTLRILLISVALAGLVYGGWSMLTEENRQTAERVAPLPERFANLAAPSSGEPTTTSAVAPPVVSPPPAAAPESAPAAAAPAPSTPAVTEPAPPVAAATPEPTPLPPAAPPPAAVVPATPATPTTAVMTPVTPPSPAPQPVLTPIPAPVAVAPPAQTPAQTPAPTPAAAPPAPAPAPPAIATAEVAPVVGDDPRRRAGDGASTNAAAPPAPLPGEEGVTRRLNTLTERPGASSITPPAPTPARPAPVAALAPAAVPVPPPSPTPAPSAAPTAAPTTAVPAAEPLSDEEEEADAPPPPPTPRATATPDSSRSNSEVTISSLPPLAAPSPAAPLTAAPPVPAVPPPSTQAFGATGEPSRITVRADTDSWVQVTTTSGQPVFARMLRSGDTYLVPNRPGLRLMTGNAGGLRIMVDGNPTPPIGMPGSVVRDVALEPERLQRGNASRNETPDG